MNLCCARVTHKTPNNQNIDETPSFTHRGVSHGAGLRSDRFPTEWNKINAGLHTGRWLRPGVESRDLILTRIQTVTAHRRQELLCLSVCLGGLSADYICRPQWHVKHADECVLSVWERGEEGDRVGWCGLVLIKGFKKEARDNERPRKDQSLPSAIRNTE